MKSRGVLIISGVFLAIILLTGACAIGFVAGRTLLPQTEQAISFIPELGLIPTTKIDPAEAGTPEDLAELFVPFWQSWALVHDQYVEQPVDDENLMRGAIDGMLEALGDPHTSYMDPDQYEMLNTQLQGEETYEGIGAWVDPNAEYLTIISPMPDSPAEEAGLISGDQIIAVDGEDMTGIDGNLVIRKVLGPAGTSLTLTVLREGDPEPFDVTLKRAHIEIPAVESEMLEDDIAYIKLFNFSATATEEISDALKELIDQEPQGLILDLRNNPGGERDAAVEIASQFVSEDVIMYQEYGDGSRDTFETVKGGQATEIDMIVLINEGSASGSEIVAGVIQDYERGALVGTTTFGKGSVQNWVPLVDDQGAVRVTIARWLTPNGRTIHGSGIEPDYIIEMTEEDFEADRDPQLDKAIELLTNP